MAKYEITAPDGNRYEITAPDSASMEDVLSYAKSNYQSKDRTISDDVVESVKNIPGSAVKLATDVAQPFLHPIDTAKGLGTLGAGLVDLGARKLESATPDALRNMLNKFSGSAQDQPGWEQGRALTSAVGDIYKGRYGSPENIRNTLVTDPVGAAADVASVLGVAGLGLKAAGATKAANIASKAGNVIDPINLAGKAITKGIAPATKAIYSRALGFTTGSGDVAIKKALEGRKSYLAAMRGQIDDAQLVDMAKDSIGAMKDTRRQSYQQALSGLKNAKNQIDITDIKTLADDWLSKYNVKKTPKGLDFSRATATGKAASEIEDVYNIVQDWGNKAGDLTPEMLDVLKRKIGDFYSSDRNSRAMNQALKKAIHEKIASNVPEYRKMTSDYAKASELLDNIESALSAGERSKADATLRKMLTAVREDKAFRRELMDQLGASGGKDLIAAASGRVMSQPWANRMGPMLSSAVGAGGAYFNPALAGLFAAASPRLVGEVSYYLGKVGRNSAKVAGDISRKGIFLGAQQVGRLPIYEEE